jgi:GntR family transcriptional regulator
MADFRYRQIAEELRARIESGEIRPGGQLPTELELRNHYEASRNTVRDAVKLLATQGLVVTRRGQGMFVNQRTEPPRLTLTVDPKDGLVGVEGEAAFAMVRTHGRFPSASVPRVEVHPASPEDAELLCVPAGDEVITRRQEWYVDGMPWALQTTVYPVELADDAPALLTASDIRPGTITYIEQTSGIVEAGRRDLIAQRRASAEEARFFGLPDDAHVPVTAVTRTGYRASGADLVPLRVTRTAYIADRVRFDVDSGVVPREDEVPAMMTRAG